MFKHKKPAARAGPEKITSNSDPGGIQTHDHLLRRQELYSAELPGRKTKIENQSKANIPTSQSRPAKIAAKIIKIRQEAKLPRIPGFTYLRPAIPAQPQTAAANRSSKPQQQTAAANRSSKPQPNTSAGKPTTVGLWMSKSKKAGNKR
jgi:hypothetical protein